jgi:hypothetical protein
MPDYEVSYPEHSNLQTDKFLSHPDCMGGGSPDYPRIRTTKGNLCGIGNVQKSITEC